MAPRKRRGIASTHSANTRGFAVLSDEIYLEIISYIPSVPIPTVICLASYPEIRRSRHETLLSLSQTSRSLRRFFWRYLWQRIEVREGMKIGNKDDTLKTTPRRCVLYDPTGHKTYATELVRQLEVVTIRNPQLAQYVNYLDVFIGEYAFKTVLSELARCLTLFSNLHTVQIDVISSYERQSFRNVFENTFKRYSYPQIRNVFFTSAGKSFIASCPQARHVGYMDDWFTPSLKTIMDHCPLLEVFEVFIEALLDEKYSIAVYVVDSSPNLPSLWERSPHIVVLRQLNYLQTIVIDWRPVRCGHVVDQQCAQKEQRAKDNWIGLAKNILTQVQLLDNLEKSIVVRSEDELERRILLKPAPFGFEEESLEP